MRAGWLRTRDGVSMDGVRSFLRWFFWESRKEKQKASARDRARRQPSMKKLNSIRWGEELSV